jgi:hypothetical protein
VARLAAWRIARAAVGEPSVPTTIEWNIGATVPTYVGASVGRQCL